MKYIFNNSKKYTQDILKHLDAYNIVHTGDKPSDMKYIYVLDDNRVAGMMNVKLGWDCVTLEEYYYSNFNVLTFMMSKISELYKGRALAIRTNTRMLSRIQDFKKLGFIIEGTLKGSRNGTDAVSFAHYKLDIKSESSFEFYIEDKITNEHEIILKGKLDEINEQGTSQERLEVLQVIVLESTKFIAGIKAIINDESLYIDLLVVKEGYRDKNIGSKLVDMIEEEAAKRHLNTIRVVTVLACGFYEKRGYSIVVTKKDQPKGFNCYTLIKKINS